MIFAYEFNKTLLELCLNKYLKILMISIQGSGADSELDYVAQTSWVLFLNILMK